MDASPEVARRFLPAVVNVRTEVPARHPSARLLGKERIGSGTVVSSDGLILTVNYVVMGGETIYVSFSKGRPLKAEIAAQDFDVGLALLKVKRQGLYAVEFGDSAPIERGDPVFLLASTGPHERQASGGIVTYVGEFEAYWEYLLERAIVSSAPNPGFGGGSLFTLEGKMVGVVSLNLNEIARNSVSIPIESFLDHQDELLRFGKVVSRPRRAWLGLFAHSLEEGVMVAGLVPNGPGERSGLREGDVIVSVNSRGISTRRDLYLSLWCHGPGERISIEVVRNNSLADVMITGGDRADFYKQIS